MNINFPLFGKTYGRNLIKLHIPNHFAIGEYMPIHIYRIIPHKGINLTLFDCFQKVDVCSFFIDFHYFPFFLDEKYLTEYPPGNVHQSILVYSSSWTNITVFILRISETNLLRAHALRKDFEEEDFIHNLCLLTKLCIFRGLFVFNFPSLFRAKG